MPTTNVNTFDTIEEWRLKTNELGVKIADLDNNLFTINVIASGNITASGNINALGNVVVTRDAVVSGNVNTLGNVVITRDVRVTGNIFGSSNLVITGNVLAANVNANVHYGTWVTSKPAINVLFNANITGSANLLLSNSGTNILTISANVAADSVTLGTHTIGNYVKEITSADTSNIIVNNGVGEGTTPTVNLAMTNVTPGLYGNANFVGSFTVTRDGRLTNASNVQIDRAYILTTGKPSVNLNFTGDVTGKANVNLSAENTNTLDVALTIQPDSVALGTDTTGNYVQAISSADTSNIIVNNGTGESSNPTVNLAMTNVTPGSYGNANSVSSFTVTRDGRLVAASNVAIDRAYILTSGKPSVNLNFTGDVTGKANLNLSAENTNILDVALTVQPNSVALGTDTTGNYVENLVQGPGVTLTNGTPAESGTPTISANVRSVGSFVGDVSNTNLLASILQVDGAGSGLDADVLDGQNGTYYLDWTNQTNKPAINVLFNANITGSANVLLTNSGTNILTISANVANDSVTLGTHTVGDFVKSVNGTTGRITSSVTSGENAATVIDLATIAGLAATQGAGNANLIPAITYDQYGRITAHSNISIDRNYGLITNKPSINIRFTGNIVGNANLTISSEGTNFLEVQANLKTLPSGTYPTGLTPGTYGAAEKTVSVKVDDVGRIISIQEQTITGVPISGDYVKTVVGGTSITVTGSSNPVANVVTVNHGDTSTLSGSQGGSGIAGITVDDNGHVTGVTTATYLTSVPVITLGSGTNGNYTDRILPGTMITVSGTADEGNVITINHFDTSTLNGLQGGSGIASITVDDRGHVTAVATATYLTSVPVITLGSGTDGNYTDRVVGGTGLTATGTANEGNVITVGLTNTGVAATTYGNATVVPVITIDAQGRITSASNVTISGVGATSSNVFSYFGAGANTISFTRSTHSAINSSQFNFFAGACAGNAITTGVYNVIFGSCAGRDITSGRHNFIAGLEAGRNNTTGSCNNFFGQRAGFCNTTGGHNTFIGDNAGYFSTFGCHNIGIGATSLNQITNGSQNISLGDSSGWVITSGNRNINLGQFAGGNITTGNDNIIVGCLTTNVGLTTNTSNVIIMATGGIRRVRFVSACHNLTVGTCSGNALTSGINNILLGLATGFRLTSGSNNNFFGVNAGCLTTTGCYNNFIGPFAGLVNTTGSGNNFFGDSSGFTNNIGSNNNFIGKYTGYNNTIGCDNVFLGTCSGFLNNSGNRNIYLGQCSGGNVTTGNDNIIVGRLASCVGLTDATSNVIIMATGGCQKVKIDSRNNFFVGQLAGICAATSCHNVGVGLYTMSSPTYGIVSGCYNTAFGRLSLRNLTSGNHNVAIGNQSLLNLQNGNDNVAIGPSTLANNFSAWRNIAIGSGAIGGGCITGYDNIAMGCSSGQCLTSAECNNFIGRGAGYYTTTGSNNNFFGSQAGFKNVGGTFNTFIGYQAGYCSTTGNYNNFLGSQAGFFNTSGIHNNFFGANAGYCNTSGNYNNVMGRWAGLRNTTGCNNVFIGHLAGCCNTTGSNNLFFGCMSGVTLGCTSTESNRIVMGNPNHCLACIQIAWTTPSDIRDKCIFGPVPHGKSFLGKINPITFSFKNRETNELKETKKRYGFSAQEVLEAEGSDPVIVGTENPEKLGFTTDFIIPILVNAVKELTKDVEELRAEIAELKKSR